MTSSEFFTPNDPRALLILNAAEEVPQIVVGCGGAAPQILSFREIPEEEALMERLLPTLDTMLRELGLRLGELAGLVCVRGPGRFTGLRIVLASALGLSRALNLPMAGLEYLPVLALGAEPVLKPGRLFATVRARRGQIYVHEFQGDGSRWSPSRPAEVFFSDTFFAMLSLFPGMVNLLGSGLETCDEERWPLCPERFNVLPQSYNRPSASALLRAALEARYSCDPIEPLYLRLSDAEENLEVIAGARGLDPGEARLRLAALRR